MEVSRLMRDGTAEPVSTPIIGGKRSELLETE